MKKNDFIIVAILVALMFVWMKFYPAIEQKYFPRPLQPVTQAAPVAVEASSAVSAPADKKAVIAEAPVAKTPEVVLPSAPEQQMTLANDNIELTISSYGGAVVSAVLKNYPAENRKASGPMILDFTNAPALRYAGLPVPAGILEKTADGLRYTAALGDGRFFERTLKLEGEYLLKVADSFVNSGADPWALPELRLPIGPMAEAKGTTAMAGVVTLGVDTFTPAEGVRHWGKEFNKLFSDATKTGMQTTSEPTAPDWVAAKNKFFVQILTPEHAASAFDLSVRRAGEGKKNVPAEVAAAMAQVTTTNKKLATHAKQLLAQAKRAAPRK